MNHSGKIMNAIVLVISVLCGLSVVTKDAMSATSAAPVVSFLPSVVDGTSTPVRTLTDSSGNYYVTDPRGGGVLKYNRNGQLLKTFSDARLRDAIGLVFAQNGELLVTHGTTVARLNVTTGIIQGTFGTFSKANGIAVDAAGNIYVADSVNDCIQKFDSSFNPVTITTHGTGKPLNSFGTTGALAGQFKRPAGITFERVSGQLAIVDSLNGRVQFFSTAGVWQSTLGQFGSGSVGTLLRFTMPKGIAFEYSGSVVTRYYVVDSFQSNVQVIDAATKEFLGYIGGYGYAQGNLVSPSDVQIDQSSPLAPVLLVANEIGLVTRYGIDSLQPTNVKVLPPTEHGKLTLTWTNPQVSSFSSIHIYRSTNSSLGTLVANIPGETFTDTGLLDNTQYFYTVRGVNSSAAETSNTDQVSGTTLIGYQLAVNMSGNGTGTVSSNLPMPGLIYNNGTYTATVNSGTVVTLMPTPDASSQFTGWTGTVCNNQTSGNCVFTMNSDVNVTASFDQQHKFKISGRGIYDDILQNIYNQALSGETIMAMSGVAPSYDVNLFLNMVAGSAINVTIAGGYDVDYQTSSGYTTLQGTVKVKAGKVVFKNIKIK